MTTKHLRYVSLLFLVTVGLTSCSHTQEYFHNPEEQLVHELAKKRVVMIGEFYHESALPMHGLTSYLSTWLTMIQRGNTDQYNITLFVEDDRQVAALVLDYLKTGDLRPLLNYVLPSTSLERLEFYADLRRIYLHIDSLNAVMPHSKQITFDVQGPEEMNVFDPRYIDSSRTATASYFLEDRDSLTAQNVIAYLKDHPLQKALIYYGSGHLIKMKDVSKDFGGSGVQGKGNLLAYYLKKQYGDNDVLCVSPIPDNRAQINLKSFGDSDVLFYSANIPWVVTQSTFELMRPDYFDAFIIRKETMCPIHPLRLFFSNANITASIKRLESLEPHLSGIFAKRFYDQSLRTLRFLTDSNFSTSAEWNRWNAHNRFDAYQVVQEPAFRKRLTKYFFNTLKSSQTIFELYGLGFSKEIESQDTLSLTSGIDWLTKHCLGLSL